METKTIVALLLIDALGALIMGAYAYSEGEALIAISAMILSLMFSLWAIRLSVVEYKNKTNDLLPR